MKLKKIKYVDREPVSYLLEFSTENGLLQVFVTEKPLHVPSVGEVVALDTQTAVDYNGRWIVVKSETNYTSDHGEMRQTSAVQLRQETPDELERDMWGEES